MWTELFQTLYSNENVKMLKKKTIEINTIYVCSVCRIRQNQKSLTPHFLNTKVLKKNLTLSKINVKPFCNPSDQAQGGNG